MSNQRYDISKWSEPRNAAGEGGRFIEVRDRRTGFMALFSTARHEAPVYDSGMYLIDTLKFGIGVTDDEVIATVVEIIELTEEELTH